MRALIAILLVSLMLFGCSAQGNPSPPPPGYSNDQGVVNAASTGNTVEMEITAKKWAFVPNEITVKKGDHVKLRITSIDVTHGFMLPEYGINERIEPGKVTTVEFTADKAGEFSFRCSVMCGEGHRGQTGKLIVLP